MQGYLNLKAYKEFAAEHRPRGLERVGHAFAVTPRADAARVDAAEASLQTSPRTRLPRQDSGTKAALIPGFSRCDARSRIAKLVIA